jgi:hypothetical protein
MAKFSTENQPANRGKNGRKKSELTKLLEAKAVASKEDYQRGLAYLLACTKAELQEIAESEVLPMWLVSRARAMYNQSGKGGTAELHDTEDRLYGKAPQTTDLTNSDGSLHTPSLVIETVKPAEK